MNLLAFSQQTTPKRFPVTIIYPAGANIATPATWKRLQDGRIEATYHSHDELYWSVTMSMIMKEAAGGVTVAQGELIPREEKGGAAYAL